MILYLLWWMPRASSNGLVAVENLETHPRPKYGKTLVNHEISLVFRPAGRPGPDQSGAKKAGEPASRGLAWTASRRLDEAEARLDC